MDTLDKLKDALRPSYETIDKIDQAEKLYWLYRIAKDNPKELEVAFLLEANMLQKSVIEQIKADDLIK